MKVYVKRAWWVIPYLNAVVLFAEVMGLEPDLEKVSATITRGFKVVTE